MEKLPKLLVFGTTAIVGWILPASTPLPKAAQGFSLSLSFMSALVLVGESRTQERILRFTGAQRSFDLERLATEMAYQHQADLDELHDRYYPEPDYQPQLPGAHPNQPVLGESASIEGHDAHFNLDWLLSSNSHHALLCGDTGAGKTLLARWLLSQLSISDVAVFDPDDDGETWQGFEVVGRDDDWDAINEAYTEALEEFNQRTPNDRSLTPKGYVLEELPDHLLECKNAEKTIARLLRRGRKRKVFVLGITQDANFDAIKLSAPLQKCFTRFFLQGYAFHALKYLVPRNDRLILTEALKAAKRPALVQFRGQFFAWDVPDISMPIPTTVTSPRTTQAQGEAQPQPDPISALTRSLTAPIATKLHWAVVDFANSRGDWVSVRDAMRSLSQLKTADQTREIFRDLVGLELGETTMDGDRLLFKSFKPLD